MKMNPGEILMADGVDVQGIPRSLVCSCVVTAIESHKFFFASEASETIKSDDGNPSFEIRLAGLWDFHWHQDAEEHVWTKVVEGMNV